jgi:hypothetical protein
MLCQSPKHYFFIFLSFAFFFSGCQTNEVNNYANPVTKGGDYSSLFKYVVPINNILLEGTIQNFYKAVDEELIEPVLMVNQERAQFILTKVKIVSVNRNNNLPYLLREIITVRDIEGDNKEYSFFFPYLNIDQGDNVYIGDEIYIAWTQGVETMTVDGIVEKYNRNEYINTRPYNCFVDNNLYRIILFMHHSKDMFEEFWFSWY